MPESDEVSEQFVSLLTMHQSQLKGFVFSALGNRDDAQDVLQKTNLTLWKKASQYRDGSPFLPWAFGVARYEVLGFLRDRSRERERVVFHTDVVDMLCEIADTDMESWPDRQQALHRCLEKMDDDTRHVFGLRYAENFSLQQIANTTNKTIDAIKSLMMRSRKSLRKCIDQRLASNEMNS
ncbi:sigma-70 family RNA polymerase sigma factor [Rhodopirellula sallentina]|uniref:RNA polymerase sigma-70 ECF-like, Rhodopirellula baltica n=1 Tax=Rhodopirellula sallentina SM41 TaxID=1263870 RepID=M5TS45_9BACT|nr:sigma-70 family RNA polymerase sigma factor [Rhodopirellula sallentina]EMI51980.1 RNA polymerase sigma-70 ECF-like, Rhodopirellula baltica [Rhodopirellula sallentina SM41]